LARSVALIETLFVPIATAADVNGCGDLTDRKPAVEGAVCYVITSADGLGWK
jgi:hypothetical protein